ncbi:MAG: HAD-IB family phosphatase [Verrucomicrobiota bacterium]
MSATKLLFLDCDSTLSAIEGIDELGGLRGPEIFQQVKELTDLAMDGKIPIDQIFKRRLDVIAPSRTECAAIARRYIERIEPTAAETVNAVRAAGWTPVILSGGFTQVIEPLAELLGIASIEAVAFCFDGDGNYAGFDEEFPTTRNGGKAEVIERWKARHPGARTVMIGDGVSDLEAKPVVDRFIGYGGFAEREKVREGAEFYVMRLADILPLLPT